MNTTLINELSKKAKAERKKENFDQAFEFYTKALAIGQEQELSEDVNNILLEIGQTFKEKCIVKNNIQYLNRAVEYFEQAFEGNYLTHKEQVTLLLEIGELYAKYEKNNLAKKYYRQALDLSDNLPTERVQLLLKLSNLASNNRESEKVIAYLKEAETIIESSEIIPELQIQVFEKITDYYVSQMNYVDVSKYAKKVLVLARSLNDGYYESKALNTVAIPHAVRGEYKAAFEYMNASLEIAESLNLTKSIAPTLVNIGNIFSALYSYEKAIKTYEKVLRDYQHELYPISLGITYFNLSNVYKGLDDLDSAEIQLNKALEIGKNLHHKLLMSRVYFELVQIYILRKDVETAIAYSFEAEKVYPQEGNPPGLETYLANQCQLNVLRQKYKTAIEYGREAISHCMQKNDLKTLKKTYKAMADAYKALGDFKATVSYLELYNKTSEEFMLHMRERQMIDLEIQYALKDKENEIERLQQKSEIDRLKLQNHFQQKINKLEIQALQAQMNPHFIFNVLNSIQYYLTINDSEKAMIYLTRFAKLIRTIFDFSRKSTISLYEEINFLKLYMQMEKLRFKQKIEVNLTIDDNIFDDNIHLPPILIQPIVENCFKHGLLHKENDGKVSVDFRIEDNWITCTVEDNGIGRQAAQKFKKRKKKTHKSAGVETTKERLKLWLTQQVKEIPSNFFQITDLKNEKGEAKGTSIKLFLIHQIYS